MLTSSIGKKIGMGYAVALFFLIVISVSSAWSIQQLNNSERLVFQTVEELRTISDVTFEIRNLQSSVRGYGLAGDKRFLEPYYSSISSIDGKMARLKDFTNDNPRQQRQLEQMAPLLAKILDWQKRTIDTRDKEGLNAVAALLATFGGESLTLEFLRLATAMADEERRLLTSRKTVSEENSINAFLTIGLGTALAFLVTLSVNLFITRSLTFATRNLTFAAEKIGQGNSETRVTVLSDDELGKLGAAFNVMAERLQVNQAALTDQDWLKSNLAKFNRLSQGQRDIASLCKQILVELAPLVHVHHGVIYVADGEVEMGLVLKASYAYKERKNISNRFKLGEGLVGECAFEQQRILLTHVPADYIQISSGLGEATPLNIVVLPVAFENAALAVIELASFNPFTPLALSLLEQLCENLGITLHTIRGTARTEELLTQALALEKQLQDQRLQLQEANEELQTQQEELRQSNEELIENGRLLVERNKEVERRNKEIDAARLALEGKAVELATTSKYKSEFLANMSHELRTPLNSVLLLAQQLRDNPQQNLTDKQVDYARTIFSSGNDLLNLINEILDLSKVEAGKVSIELAQVLFADVIRFIDKTFRPVAENKKLALELQVDPTTPTALVTDEQRLNQILKNLLSNAFKFTMQGSVSLRIAPATQGWSVDHPVLRRAEGVIAFSISDTGVGIPIEKQHLIFEAFQQADTGTARKYGGTGLGLTISRELTRLLGGEIQLKSTPGVGSVFTLYLPVRNASHVPDTFAHPLGNSGPPTGSTIHSSIASSAATATQFPSPPIDLVADDRSSVKLGDRAFLIIGDDSPLAKTMMTVARSRGFKALVAASGNRGLELANQYQPSAIGLDINLSDMSGWTVLDQLKRNPAVRHIPIYVLSVADEERSRAMHQGAFGFTAKPSNQEALSHAFDEIERYLQRNERAILVIQDHPSECQKIELILSNTGATIHTAGNGAQALALLKTVPIDCMVLDLVLPDMSGFTFLDEILKLSLNHNPPVLVYTARDLTREEDLRIRNAPKNIVIKSIHSLDRLLDEVTLFMHIPETNLPQEQQQMLLKIRQLDPVLSGKTVMIVDDDIRNIFAITAALERYGAQTVPAENGKDAISRLKQGPPVDAVLMDIMMPEMDGYATMRVIRTLPTLATLPVIALTAKAMKGDRDKCIEAGASDYITKPVNMEQLLSLLRVWMVQ